MRLYRTIALATVILAAACRTVTQGGKPVPVHLSPDVVIDHASGVQDPIGLIRKKPGESVWIRIVNTNTSKCYSFNVAAAPKNEGAAAADAPMNETVDFHFLYDGTPTKITIEALRKDETCPDLTHTATGKFPPWEIIVDNAGWDLNFSGGFTIDTLTDPVYGLVAGSKALDPTQPTNKTPGFFVQRFSDQEDKYKLGAAAMVHLIHTDPEYLGRASINWVPVAFGLGVNQGSQVRYFLGSGLKFNKKLFLSAGPVFGSVHTLPAGVTAQKTADANFTTNANALSTLPSRVTRGWYFSIAYTFTGSPEPFQTPFTNVRPTANSATSTTAGSGGKGDTAYSLDVAAKDSYANKTHTVTVGEAKGGPVEIISFQQQLHSTATAAAIAGCTDEGGNPCASQITMTIDIPSHKIEGTIKMAPSKTYAIDITQTLPGTAQPEDLMVKIFHGTDPTKLSIIAKTIKLPPLPQ